MKVPKYKRGDMVVYGRRGPAYLVVNVVHGQETSYDLASATGRLGGVPESCVRLAEGDQRGGELPEWAQELQAEAMKEPWLTK